MGKALYRKYRPKNLSQVVGQEHITTTLANAIKAGKISHAYLLTGTRGVGKTSLARILAHELNGLEYTDDRADLDIIEIDAASNRRIDEIRDLRDKVHILPTSSKYKVYIIDEVHMLTKEAFNALLKTLEEPPEHAIFILATTEAHKLPETIISRTQHFSFKPIEEAVIVNHLKGIAKSEKFKIDDDALKLIAKHGDGSFRDSISLLDQARGLSDAIGETEVQNLLGIAPAEALDKLLDILSTGTAGDLFTILNDLRGQGLQAGNLARQLSERLRNLLIHNAEYQNTATTKLLADLLKVTSSSQPDRTLELVLLDYIFGQRPTPVTQARVASVPAPQQTPKSQSALQEVAAPKTAPSQPTVQPKTEVTKSPKDIPAQADLPDPKPEAPTQISGTGEPFDLAAWPIVVAEVKKKYNTVYGILRMANATVDNDTLTLAFKFAFHQKQINESKNRKIITDIIKEQTGQDITLVCVVGAAEPNPAEAAVPTTNGNSAVSNVSDIFGGAEVLDS